MASRAAQVRRATSKHDNFADAIQAHRCVETSLSVLISLACCSDNIFSDIIYFTRINKRMQKACTHIYIQNTELFLFYINSTSYILFIHNCYTFDIVNTERQIFTQPRFYEITAMLISYNNASGNKYIL